MNSYTVQEKERAVRLAKETSTRIAAKKLGIPRGTLKRWRYEQNKKTHSFCKDCLHDHLTCGKNPIDCQKEARLYFRFYDRGMAG